MTFEAPTATSQAAELIQLAVVVALAGALALKIRSQGRRGIRSVVLGRAGRGWIDRLEPAAVGLLFLWFGAVAAHGAGLAPALFEPRWPRLPAAELAGAALSLAALAVLVTAFLHMGRSWRIGIDPDSRERLVTSGIFSLSRNPIFLAIDLLALSSVLVSGSVFFLVSGALVVTGIHVQILREERFLAGVFGDEYARYRARVARYLGRRRQPLRTRS
jgi:protein-S-isoprenylcysteine O-methyltransferase Ste14